MSRCIMFWDYNFDQGPVDMKEKKTQWLTLSEIMKELLKNGEVKEWAHYAGESAGSVIVEGNEQDLLKLEGSYAPYVKFTTKTLLNLDQCIEVWKSLKE